MQAQIQIEPFQPRKGIANRHFQTIAGRYARKQNGLIFHRWRIDTPDGDFLDLDFPEIPGFVPDDSAPIVLLLHGLEGHARKGYACETYRQLAQHGVRSVGLNYRSCSGEINLTPTSYHAGLTDDVDFVVSQLKRWFPQVPFGAIGFSLGANILLKYLGEQGERVRFETAVAVSPPFSFSHLPEKWQNRVRQMYVRYFMRSLRQKVLARSHLLEGLVDIDKALAARNFRELDKALTVPLYGFQDINDYYEQCSSGRYLPDIQIPTLLIRALDDPMFDPEDVPYETIAANPFLHGFFTEHGGHVGFLEGQPGHWRCWAERQAARFLAANLGMRIK